MTNKLLSIIYLFIQMRIAHTRLCSHFEMDIESDESIYLNSQKSQRLNGQTDPQLLIPYEIILCLFYYFNYDTILQFY